MSIIKTVMAKLAFFMLQALETSIFVVFLWTLVPM